MSPTNCRPRRKCIRSTSRRLPPKRPKSMPAGPKPRFSAEEAMRRGLFFVLVAPGAALLIFFFLIPLAAVSKDGFADGGQAFLRVLRNDLFWGGLRGTLVLAATASVFSLVVGFAVALHLSRIGN